MDIRVLLNFVANNAEKIIGTTAALFFLTCIVLLVRSISNKDEQGSAGGGASLDVNEIEGVMRRVLSSQAVQVSGPVAVAEGAAGGDPAQVASLNEALRQREDTIGKLTQQLEKLRTEVAAAPAGGGEGGGDTAGLKAKLEELQARLAEYEIIEDDIADLSLFKEENARLKSEIEKLKSSLGGAPVAAAAAAPQPAAAPAPPPPAPAPAPAAAAKSEGFELDPNDDVMKEFAAAVSVQKAPPPKADTGIPTPPPVLAAEEDPQAAIDALMAKMGSEEPAADPFAGALDVAAEQAPADDPQSAIDAMLAAAEAEKAQADKAADAMVAKSAAPVADEVSQDEIDKMLAGGLDDDPLAGTPDPDKMLSEVAALGLEADAGTDVLEESLDTDKLLAEVDDLKTTAKNDPKGAPAKDVAPGDDLLAEFKADEGA